MPNTDFVLLAAPGVCRLEPYQPGKPTEELEREYGVAQSVKLASNEGPLGPGAKALAAAQAAMQGVGRYPDGSGHRLKCALSAKVGIAMERITLGNGSNDLLDLVARAFLTPATSAVFSRHAFAVYAIVTQAAGAEPIVIPADDGSHGNAWGHDLEAMDAAVRPDTRVVFIANPNNPTGTWLSADALGLFLRRVPGDVIVVVDEAYFEYVREEGYPDCTGWLERFPNLVVTRTFSKAYGLAGLRVGYGMSHPDVADLLNRVRQPFNVNSIALAAAKAALEDEDHLRSAQRVNREGLVQLCEGFQALGLSWIPTAANFLSVDIGQGAADVYEALLRRGVIVRPIANYEMPRHLRITVGTREENRRCLEALRAVLG